MKRRKVPKEWEKILSEEMSRAVSGDLLDVSAIAEKYGVSRNTIYKYLREFFGENWRDAGVVDISKYKGWW